MRHISPSATRSQPLSQPRIAQSWLAAAKASLIQQSPGRCGQLCFDCVDDVREFLIERARLQPPLVSFGESYENIGPRDGMPRQGERPSDVPQVQRVELVFQG